MQAIITSPNSLQSFFTTANKSPDLLYSAIMSLELQLMPLLSVVGDSFTQYSQLYRNYPKQISASKSKIRIHTLFIYYFDKMHLEDKTPKR